MKSCNLYVSPRKCSQIINLNFERFIFYFLSAADNQRRGTSPAHLLSLEVSNEAAVQPGDDCFFSKLRSAPMTVACRSLATWARKEDTLDVVHLSATAWPWNIGLRRALWIARRSGSQALSRRPNARLQTERMRRHPRASRAPYICPYFPKAWRPQATCLPDLIRQSLSGRCVRNCPDSVFRRRKASPNHECYRWFGENGRQHRAQDASLHFQPHQAAPVK